jgi:cytochrome c biogenesis protein CcdA
MEHTQLRDTGLRQVPLYAVAGLLALTSAAVHFILAPGHFQEWIGYGAFFLIVASLQTLYGLGLLARDARLAVSLWYLVAGILGTLLVMEAYAVTRTVGIPLLGPHAGHVEEFATIDVLSKVVELGLVATLAAMLVRLPGLKLSFGTGAKLVTAVFLTLAVALALTGLATRVQRQPLAVFQQAELRPSPGAPTQTVPTLRELLPILTRSGWGPSSASVDMIYAPPLVFQVTGDEVPTAALERPTLIFVMAEADHEHNKGLTPQPPSVLLRVDGGKPIEPYQVAILSEGSEHRTSQLLFPLPSGLDPVAMAQERHTLALVMPLGPEGESTFTWRLPLGLAGEDNLSASPVETSRLPVSALSRRLSRTKEIDYKGKEVVRVQATYATSDYFNAALPPEAASRFLPDRFTIFALAETLHTATLPSEPLSVSLRLDGRQYEADLAEQVVSSPHHRVRLLRFPVEPPVGLRHRVMEIMLPQDERLVWHLPIINAATDSVSGFRLTWVSVLAVLGGLVAAMWPCLFQLTVFFLPSLAGLSMHQAQGSAGLLSRAQVLKAALFFVLGFTLVYTAAGALIGFAAQKLGETPDFGLWQRYLGIGGGIVIILLALRVAAKVRAPLVCKMPVLSRMGHSTRAANPLELMFAGVAFATGCMTCFGAALVVAMVVYVGLSGSAAFGALTLFLFSLGMGIPLVIAATAMAKVLPLLFRMEKAVRWMGLASALVMVGFAILLITGNYMVLTEWVYRLLPLLSVR